MFIFDDNQLNVLNNKHNCYCFKRYLDNCNFYIKNESRPNTDILIFNLFEWNNYHFTNSKSKIEQKLWRITEKAFFKISYITHIILQYKQSRKDFNRITTTYEPST